MRCLFCFIVVLLLPVSILAEEAKVEMSTEDQNPYDQFNELWQSVYPQVESATKDKKQAVIKEHWQHLIELRDKVAESPLSEDKMVTFGWFVWFMLSEFYPHCDEEFRKEIFDSTNAFFERIKEKPELRDVYDKFFEAVQVFPLKTKLMGMDEMPNVAAQLQLMAELYTALKKYEFREESWAIYELSDLFRGGLNTFDSHFKNPGMRKIAMPVAKNFAALLSAKQNKRFQEFGKILAAMVDRVESQGKKSPWDEMPFVTVDGREMKIADFRGKTLLLAFNPTQGPQIPLLKRCERQWGEQGLAVLLIVEYSPDVAGKIMDLCGVTFPVWLEWEKLRNNDFNLPQRSAPYFANYMLLDTDGNVVNPYVGNAELVAELTKTFGPADVDIQQEVDALPGKIRGGKLLENTENMTLDERVALMQDATAVMVSPISGSLDEGLINGFGQLVDLADLVAEKSDDKTVTERAFASLLLMMEMNGSLVNKNPDVLSRIRDNATKHGLERIAFSIQLKEFGKQIEKLQYPNELDKSKIVAARSELFALLDASQGKWQPGQLIDTFRMLEYAVYRCNDETQAETYAKMAAYLADATDEQTQKQGRIYLGMAHRHSLMSKPMPIEGVTVEGETFDQQSYLGKIVLIDFWTTWCGPCLAEIPNMKNLYEKYHERGFDIISISIDDDLEALERFHEKRPLPWVCLADKKLEDAGKESMAIRYGVTSIPTMLLLDREGKVIMFEARGAKLAVKLAEIFD